MRRFLRGIGPYLLYIATAGMIGAWVGTAWVVFTTRDPSYLIGFGLWTFNVQYYVRWSYRVHVRGRAQAAMREAMCDYKFEFTDETCARPRDHEGAHLTRAALALTVTQAAAAMDSGEPHYLCPFCGAVSYNENDIEHGYCGRCHEYSK